MDGMQVRFLTTQALYGKSLQERNHAVRQLTQSSLSDDDVQAIGIRLELALDSQDEYVHSAAAMLLAKLAEHIPVSGTMAERLLSLSHAPQEFAREAALRAIKRVCTQGHCLSPEGTEALQSRLEQARWSESADFILSLFEE